MVPGIKVYHNREGIAGSQGHGTSEVRKLKGMNAGLSFISPIIQSGTLGNEILLPTLRVCIKLNLLELCFYNESKSTQVES